MHMCTRFTQWDEAAFSAAAGDGDTITFDQWALAFRPEIAVSAAPNPKPDPRQHQTLSLTLASTKP